MNKPVAWMVYTMDGQSVYVTDNPTDIKSGQRALPLYTEEPLQAVAAERERCAKVCEERADKYGEGDGYSPSKESGCFECAAAIRKGE